METDERKAVIWNYQREVVKIYEEQELKSLAGPKSSLL
jgi:hypothetical protein